MHRLRKLQFATSGLAAVAGASVRTVFQTKEFIAACRDLPTTPSGANPYDVLEITVTPATTLEDVSKQFRSLVVKVHPDMPEGSTEKMTEVNMAYKIVKEQHASVLKKMSEVKLNTAATNAYAQQRHARAGRDEELGRSGGVPRRRNVKADAAAQQQRGVRRSLRDIEADWTKMKEDTEAAVKSMCSRYELVIQQGEFFRKSSTLTEVTVRERWLRKSFVKGLWEDVHELRGELLRRGARSAQQSELAEEMVSFASATQRTLTDDFQRLTQRSVQAQSRMMLQRTLYILIFSILFVKFCRWFIALVFNNSLTVRLKKGILST